MVKSKLFYLLFDVIRFKIVCFLSRRSKQCRDLGTVLLKDLRKTYSQI